MRRYIVYIVVVTAVIGALFVVLNFFPRSTYSELERRELSQKPEFSFEALKSGEYTKGVSAWYSDTEPFRDEFMTLSMQLRQARALHIGADEEQITYVAGEGGTSSILEEDLSDASKGEENTEGPFRRRPVSPLSGDTSAPTLGEELSDQSDLSKVSDLSDSSNKSEKSDLEERTKITNSGILIVGKAPNARAMMAYMGKGGGESYAKVVNTYKETFGDDVQIYCMIIPTAVEFYCPERAQKATKPESATIDNLYANLLPSVKQVHLLPVLEAHKSEPIYLRTDHHWSPRGAYYAAQELCRVAGVHVPTLDEFDERVTHRFVGTMYGFSGDISLKQSPEDFVYYEPRDVEYTTTYTVYDVDSLFRVVGEHRPYKGEFFHHFRDGSGKAYCTFMGGDTKITKVETSTKNGRKLLILKDSFGNALPGYLFGSFEEIHVIDGRYFTKNMVDYVSQNGITDLVFANNVFKAYGGGKQYRQFLTQRVGGSYTPRVQVKDTVVVASEPGGHTPSSLRGTPSNLEGELSDKSDQSDKSDVSEIENGTVFAEDSLTNNND